MRIIFQIRKYYDGLNRLKGKQYYDNDICPTYNQDIMNVLYWYDDYSDATIFNGYTGATTYAVGRRTGMLDASGRSMWTYDNRGRSIREQKVINGTGGGTFVTRWGYNSADLTTWMKYPSNNASGEGETVNFTYLNQMLVNSVIGTNTYVQQTQYEAAGRVDLRKLGTDVLRTDYTYYGWDAQGGWLQSLKTGPSGTPNQWQDFAYTYDSNGDVKTILDAKNSNQKQCFVYDGMDRLTRGTTNYIDASCPGTAAGNGQYDESYTYNATTGNLKTKGTYWVYYGDLNHAHAATSWNGWTYTYDTNGNMQTRKYKNITYTPTYDPENRLTGVTGEGVNVSFVYDGDGSRIIGTIGTSATTTYVSNYFEWKTSTGDMVDKPRYYYAGSTRVAMRTGSSTLNYLLGDHLGS